MAWTGVWLLVVVVFVFVVIRIGNDLSHLSAGTVPEEGSFDRRYVLNPWPAYLHIVPGSIYLLGALLQFSARFRRRHLTVHRRMGKVVLAAGLVTGVLAIVVGIVMPFGRLAEASATMVFGLYFLASLLLAFRAIRSLDVFTHRRWMTRAFAIGAGVGLIRIVVGLGETFGVGIEDSFGAAFWIAFALMAVMAETWLWLRPSPPD